MVDLAAGAVSGSLHLAVASDALDELRVSCPDGLSEVQNGQKGV